MTRRRVGMPSPPALFSRTWLVWCLGERGEVVEARQRVREALEIAAASEQLYSVAQARFAQGILCYFKGDLTEAAAVLELARGHCEAGNLRLTRALIEVYLGRVHSPAGKPPQPVAVLVSARAPRGGGNRVRQHGDEAVARGLRARPGRAVIRRLQYGARRSVMRTRFVPVSAVLGFVLTVAVALAADPCGHRGKLDALYCDENHDLVADPPKDPAKLVSPDPLIFTYAPVEDPAVYEGAWGDFLKHLEKVTGKKTKD